MKLTTNQGAFLESLKEKLDNGQWAWCQCFKGEWRTAKSLERMGLVEIMSGSAGADFFEARLKDAGVSISYEDLFNLARKLALALANEVAFSGKEAGSISLALLSWAREELGLESAFDEIDSLRGDRQLVDNNEKGCTCTQLTALEPVVNPDCPIHGPMQQPRA